VTYDFPTCSKFEQVGLMPLLSSDTGIIHHFPLIFFYYYLPKAVGFSPPGDMATPLPDFIYLKLYNYFSIL
jgi:hypothetical protein